MNTPSRTVIPELSFMFDTPVMFSTRPLVVIVKIELKDSLTLRRGCGVVPEWIFPVEAVCSVDYR